MDGFIAIVDDETDIAELISVNLKKAGFNTVLFNNGKDFLNYTEKNKPALIILDLMLPDFDGIEICRIIREKEKLSHIPIIMLTARASEGDKILGFEMGADDYVTKPFSPRELTARIKAVLRRFEKGGFEKQYINIDNKIKIDEAKHQVYVEKKKIELTSSEFKILKILCRERGKVFSREEMLTKLWGSSKAVTDRTIDVHIRHLRKKLGNAGNLIKNVRGIGYKIEE